MNSVSISSASRRAMLIRAFFTAIALAFVQFVPSHALALGTVTLDSKELDESDGRWKLVFKIDYGSTPHIAHIPMIFSFTPTVLYERSLTDQSPEKPVLTRIPLQNQQAINESMDVGFSNSDGKIYKGTKFDFVIKRAKGFEAGEYDLKITRSDDGVQMGQTIKLKLKGDNVIVDRRAMVFSGEKRKKPEEKKDEKAEEKKDGEGGGEDSSAASDSTSSSSETPTEAPPATPPKQGGCGCHIVDDSTETSSALAALLFGAAVVWRRRVRRS